MTPAEILRELIKKDGKPERLLKQYEAFGFVGGDPVMMYLMEGFRKGGSYVDKWGVTIRYEIDAPGPMPYITEETKVLKDITKWKETVKAPDLSRFDDADWSIAQMISKDVHDSGKLTMELMGTGIFEQCHYLMGFEDTLTNLYEHPAEMHELIEYILEYRMRYAKLLIDHLHPDAILSHDDWGAKDALFMPEEVWREFFKEPYRKFYGYMKSQGVIVMHHADSWCASITKDMAEIGIDIWQGVLPENNIPELLEELDGSLTLMGGIGAAIDRSDSDEAEIRAYTERVLEECAPLGHFIPCITYGLPGTVYKHVDPVIDAVIEEYNQVVHLPRYHAQSSVHRILKKEQEKENAVKTSKEENNIIADISEALRKGKRKKTLELVTRALHENYDASVILNEGLVDGMNKLGNDFSENKAFIPDMLMAAKCMNAATELLKPELKGETESKGRVCIGTVKGDMHDIGKNLVKIMMEGAGFEVIDLGTDVSPEVFVETAIEKKCDIISCSALLTTTMDHMREVVQCAKERGIRDDVIIMIGGAPITQAFCDEIGADIYTDDAGAAARAAAEAVRAGKKTVS